MKMTDGFKTFFRNIEVFSDPGYDIFTCTFYNKDKSEYIKFEYDSTFSRRLSDDEFNFVRRFHEYTRRYKYGDVYYASKVGSKEMVNEIKSLISRSNWVARLDKDSYVLSIGGEYVKIMIYSDEVSVYYLTQRISHCMGCRQLDRIRDCLDAVKE